MVYTQVFLSLEVFSDALGYPEGSPLWGLGTLKIASQQRVCGIIWKSSLVQRIWVFPGGSDGKASACDVGVLSSIPGSERSHGEGNGNPLQDSLLENSMDRRAW